jgi:hypothetical protein
MCIPDSGCRGIPRWDTGRERVVGEMTYGGRKECCSCACFGGGVNKGVGRWEKGGCGMVMDKWFWGLGWRLGEGVRMGDRRFWDRGLGWLGWDG